MEFSNILLFVVFLFCVSIASPIAIFGLLGLGYRKYQNRKFRIQIEEQKKMIKERLTQIVREAP